MPTTGSLSEISEAIKSNPQDADAYFLRGSALATARQYTQALKDLSRAAELDPKFAKAFSLRAYVYAEIANYTRSVEDATRAIEADSTLVEAFRLRGFSNSKLGEFKSAVDDLAKAIALREDNYFAYRDRGLALLRLGRIDEGKRDLQKEIEILNKRIENPENSLCSASFYKERGSIRRVLDQYAEAENDLMLSKQIDPHNAETYYYLGQIYLRRNSYYDAVNAISHAIELIPEYALAYETRARACDGLKEFEKAAADRRRFSELSNSRGPTSAPEVKPKP